MSEASYSLMLRNLSSDYYNNHIDFDSYRNQRKIILDKIDKELNGARIEPSQENDDEVPDVLMQTIGFFKNTDVDN